MVDRANSFKQYHKMGKHIFYSGFQEELNFSPLYAQYFEEKVKSDERIGIVHYNK